MTKRFFLIAFMLLIAACVSWADDHQANDDLETAASWMSGYFSSQAQAEQDTNYFDIRLRMVPIWPERDDGYWLYVEQAVADYQERPYRQRVYHVTQRADGAIESAIYTLENPLRFAGAWKEPAPLQYLTPDSLSLRDGCAVILQRKDETTFEGSTVENNCPSDLRGASYATSEVVLKPDKLISWDRGYDSEDQQVWGATEGGYIFLKIADDFQIE